MNICSVVTDYCYFGRMGKEKHDNTTRHKSYGISFVKFLRPKKQLAMYNGYYVRGSLFVHVDSTFKRYMLTVLLNASLLESQPPKRINW